MKNKTLIGLIATATIGSAITTPIIMHNQKTTHISNKVLMVNNTNNSSTNEAVVINGNSSMNLYALANGTGIVSNLSTGEMLTILGQAQNGYCKVRVQETGAVGYINIANMQNILNGTNDTFTQLSGNGQVVNVSSNVRLRSNPAIGNNIIGHLTNGTSFSMLGKQGQWYKVSINGKIGFIYEEYVSISTTDSNSQSTINISTTNASNSNSSSDVNPNNHVKNVVVRTKSSITSNVNETSNSNITKNNSQSKIINKTKSSSSSQVNNKSNIRQSSKINNKSNSKEKESFATFSLATINRDCSLYNAPKGEKSLKLNKGDKIFIIDSGFDYSVKLPKGWAFVRTAMGGGYLPLIDLNINNNTKYNIKILTKDCNLYSNSNLSSKTKLDLTTGAQVFVPVNDGNSSSKWTLVMAPKTLTAFELGYLPSNILAPTARIGLQG